MKPVDLRVATRNYLNDKLAIEYIETHSYISSAMFEPWRHCSMTGNRMGSFWNKAFLEETTI